MTPLEKVLAETRRYDHALLDFSAREHNGTIELVIELKDRRPGPAHLLRARPRPRHRAPAVPLDLPALPLRLHARLPGRDVRRTPQSRDAAAVTPAGEILAAEIRRDGPIPFRRFMEVALYHPEHGYYRRAARSVRQARRLLHRRAAPARLRHSDGRAHPPALPRDGRAAATSPSSNSARAAREMARGVRRVALRSGRYRFRRAAANASPASCSPTSSSTRCRWRSRCTTAARSASSCVDVRATALSLAHRRRRRAPSANDYLRRYFPAARRGPLVRSESRSARVDGAHRARARQRIRVHHRLRLSRARRSSAFPPGTLMGYRRHTAREDVLDEPGERDITAHVNFTALEERGAACGLRPRTLRDARADAARAPARPISSPPRSATARGGTAPPHAAEDAAVRDGRDVPGSAAEENGRGEDREAEGKVLNNEKGPGNRGLGVKPVC